MHTEDRRIPMWVPVATAVVGALAGFGLVLTLGADETDAGTVPATGVAAVTPDRELLDPTADGGTQDADAPPDAPPGAPDETATAPTPAAAATLDDRTPPEPTVTLRPTPVPLPTPTPQPTTAPATPASPATTAASPSLSTVSREQAGAIAAAHVAGVVDSISREDDYGAAWDVDVYAPDGEYTIYVSATGRIVRIEGPFRD